jgi:YVTN family beta-propeller protein
MRSQALLFACVATTLAAAPTAARAKPMLLVSAEAGGEVVLVDPGTAEVVARVAVGARPRGMKLSRDGRQLFVAVAGAQKAPARAGAPAPAPAGPAGAGIAVLDVAGRKVVKQIATPPGPFAVDLLPDGKTAFLSSSETNELLTIDLGAGTIKKKTGVGTAPQDVAVRPDGKVVYVAAHGADEVSAIDTKTMSLLGRIDAGSRPQIVLFAPRAQTAVVIDEGLPTVTTLDLKQNTFKEQFAIPGLPKTTPPPALQSAVFSPDGKRLYVTTGAGRSVLIVDPTKKTVVGTIDAVGMFVRGIAISKDGKKLYTANGPSNDVAIINIATKKVEKRVAVPGAPWGVVVVP